MVPNALTAVSLLSLLIAALCSLIIARDEVRRPQRMGIMNLVWPITALFGSVLWLWFYWRFGRAEPKPDGLAGHPADGKAQPRWTAAAKAASHCGAGCTLGDLCAEGLAAAFPGTAAVFGYGTIFHDRMFADWVLDFVLAYGFGLAFQYLTIAPMRRLGVAAGLWAAIKADTLSLIAWQVGMYGFMAFARYILLGHVLHVTLVSGSVGFWLVMQWAMLTGFATSYPVNAWLLKSGIKEPM